MAIKSDWVWFFFRINYFLFYITSVKLGLISNLQKIWQHFPGDGRERERNFSEKQRQGERETKRLSFPSLCGICVRLKREREYLKFKCGQESSNSRAKEKEEEERKKQLSQSAKVTPPI